MEFKQIYVRNIQTGQVAIFNVNSDQTYVDLPTDLKATHEEIQYIEFQIQNKIQEVKFAANQYITQIYPYWKQINYLSDLLLSKAQISSIMNISYETVMTNVFTNYDPGTTIEEIIEFQNDLATLDISNLLTGCPEDKIELVTIYYKKIMQTLIAERYIELVRTWSNEKEAYIIAQNCTTFEELNLIHLDDYPKI